MKKISLVLALVFSVLVTTAQTWTKVNGRWEYQYMRFDNTVGTFTPPQDTIPGAPVGSLAVKNDIPYYKTSSSGWIPVTGAAANLATTNLTATGNYSHNWNNKQLIIDSVNQYYLFTRAKQFGLWNRANISIAPTNSLLLQEVTRKADNSQDSLSAVLQMFNNQIRQVAGDISGTSAILEVNAGAPTGKSSIVARADTIRMQAIPRATADTVLATGPYDPVTKTNPLYKIKLNTNGQNIANTNLEATGDYDQNWKNYQLRIDSMKRMGLIARGNLLGNQSRSVLSFEPSFPFLMTLQAAQRDAANLTDSMGSTFQFISDGGSWSAQNTTNGSAAIQLRTGLSAGNKPYISLSADSILAKLKPVSGGDSILVAGTYNPGTGFNPIYKAPLNGLVGAQNGLTKNGINIELGGALTKLDTISINNTAHGLKFIGKNTFASDVPMVDIQDTLTTSGGIALRASSKGSGSAIQGYTIGPNNGTGVTGYSYLADGFTYGQGTGVFGGTGTGTGVYAFAQSTGMANYAVSGSGLAYYGSSSLGVFNFETINATYPVSGVHTIGTFGKLNQGQFFGAPGAGFGSSVDYSLTADNGTSNGATRVGLKFITKWATATDASRSAAWEMQLVNNATLGRRLRMEPDGVLTLDRYAASVSGTPAFGLGVDNTGKLVTTAVGSTTTASNGLTMSGSDVQLGGTITGVTTINSTGSSSNRIVINGTSSTAWAPFYSLDNGTGAALMGLQNNASGRAFIAQNFASGGVSLSSTSGDGVAVSAFDGGTGVGVGAASSQGIPMTALSDLNNGNATNTLLQLTRNNGTAATGASVGMGGDILTKLEDGTSLGTTLNASKISTYWTSVTSGSEKSALDFWTLNNGYFSSKFSIRDTGQLQAYRYGGGNFETVDTSYPAAVFGPDGKIYARRGDHGGGGGSTPTWQETLTAGPDLTADVSSNANGHQWGITNSSLVSLSSTDGSGNQGAFVGIDGQAELITNNSSTAGFANIVAASAGVTAPSCSFFASYNEDGFRTAQFSMGSEGYGIFNIRNSTIGSKVQHEVFITDSIKGHRFESWHNNGYTRFSITDTLFKFERNRSDLANLDFRLINLPRSSSGTDSVLVKDASGRVYSRAQSAIAGSTPTWQQTLTAGSALTTNNDVDLSGTDFKIGGNSDAGYYYQKYDNANGVLSLVNKFTQAGADSMALTIDANAAEIALTNHSASNNTIGVVDVLQTGVLATATSTNTSRVTEFRMDTSAISIEAKTSAGAGHGISVFKDSIEIASNLVSQTKLYIPYLPRSSSSADSVLVRDATGKIFTRAQSDIVPAKVKFVQTATVSVIANDNETTLIGSGTGSLTIPAGTMTAGKAYRLTVRGTYGTDATNPAQQNWRLYLGGTLIEASGNAGLGTNRVDKVFVTQIDITCRSAGSSGSVMVVGMFNTEDGPGAKSFPPTTTTINTTGSLTLDFTTDLTDGSAGNNIKVYSLIFEEI